jgi:protein-ribulosamine 3-kinase
VPADVISALARRGLAPTADPPRAVLGGGINRTVRLITRRGPLLLKLNAAERLDAFEAEAEGLAALAGTGGVAVPRVLAVGAAAEAAFIALEWIDFAGCSAEAERRLGRGLAQQHRETAADFGWHRDNYLGATVQPNGRDDSWPRFFARRRLRVQLDLGRQRGLPADIAARCERLAAGIDRCLAGADPRPALLHGDLWGGNWGATADGRPYVYDPAVYFGDREADLAMTRLFGGFGREFYRAYEEAWPLEPGWEARVDLYNLYHVLNHFNLFGAAYLAQLIEHLQRLELSRDE